jgi:hypothetical protein
MSTPSAFDLCPHDHRYPVIHTPAPRHARILAGAAALGIPKHPH